jgi:hypothetical protein
VVAVRGDDRPPVGGHDRRGEQVVERESVEADQVPDPTAEGEPGHARVAERPAGRREAVSLAGRVEVLPECAAAACRGARLRIDDDVAHQPQVDHHAALAHAVAGDAVATSADGDRKVALARVRQGGDDVFGVERAHDQRRSVLDHRVVRDARGRVPVVLRRDHRTAMSPSELVDRHASNVMTVRIPS